MNAFRQDVRGGAKAIRKHPTLSAATIATLGLATAAAVTVFGFIDTVYLRPLTGPDASRLVRVYLPSGREHLTLVGAAGVAVLRGRTDLFDPATVREHGDSTRRIAARR